MVQRGYKIRERPKIKAGDKVGHGAGGDIDKGKAWRALRRPSDMVS
jgi:serine/arginine repetitive matrix protein 2